MEAKNWTASYSRNLVVSEKGFTNLLHYTDHTGTSLQYVWQVKIENRRPDIAAFASVCILDRVEDKDGNPVDYLEDRSYLKWAGQKDYEKTILPEDFGLIDAFTLRSDKRGLFLHSSRDTPREPIVENDGEYVLFYKLFSQGFPLWKFQVKIDLQWAKPTQMQWPNNSAATLLP